ncbi:hypothetical protein CK203_099894 [Vitis vinifera]|uniref:Chromo domain-containing protein n=1 Tax=Vitis vinifera TaxID=29760 RepID=A0A438CEQ0_VITVI|nr:hypothetical protein CK203_099894 [Vitis vinifera]
MIQWLRASSPWLMKGRQAVLGGGRPTYTKGRRLYVPKWGNIRRNLIKECHDTKWAGTLGNDALGHYSNKVEQRQPRGLLTITIAERPWDSVTMDFIIGLPKSEDNGSIIVVVDSDRDPVHWEFWTELFKLMGSELHFSTSFHPQTDGQTERVNALLELYLRHFGSNLNSSHANDRLHGEKSSGFQVREGWHEQADIARSYLDKAAKKMKKWADKKRHHTEYKVGDMVLVKLLPQQFKSLRPVHKGLVRRYEGPFPILGKVGKVSYKVELPPDRIIRRRGVPPATEYLVKWKGLPESEASWEPAMHYGSFRSRLSGSGQKTRRGRLQLRWGRVSQDALNEPPHGLYRRWKLLET